MSLPIRKSMALLCAVPLLLAGCSSSSATVPPLTRASGSTTEQAPAAPTDFTALIENGSVPCPSPDPNNPDSSCKQTNLAWTYGSAPGTWFRIYRIWIGEDPSATCAASETQASVVLETKPGITSARLFDEVSVGGGPPCLWITAVNATGESQRVPAQGQ
jgi:hypothetical protein